MKSHKRRNKRLSWNTLLILFLHIIKILICTQVTRQPHGKPDTKPAWHQVCQGLGAEIRCSEILGASFLEGYVESPHRNPETIDFGDLFRASILENSPVSGKGWSWFQKHHSAPWLQSLQSPKLPISSNGTWAQFDQLCVRTFLRCEAKVFGTR